MSDDRSRGWPAASTGPPDGSPPPAWVGPTSSDCHACGSPIDARAGFCSRCGARQGAVSAGPGKDRAVAATFALFLGTFGVHKFYLGRLKLGVLYLILCWTYIPTILGWVEGMLYLRRSDEAWLQRYPGPVKAPSSRAIGCLWALALLPLLLIPVWVGLIFLGGQIDAILKARVGPTIGTGRIERAQHGFAITFPDEWMVREVTSEGALILLEEGGPLEGQTLVLAAERSSGDDACRVFVDDPTRRGETGLLGPTAVAVGTGWKEDGTIDRLERERIDLSAGPAWRIDASGEGFSTSIYLLRGPDALYSILCSAEDPPEDRWLPIADSFEFLPDAVTGVVPSSPVLGSGRIERPDDGFALTFPDDWTVEEMTAEAHEMLFGHVGPEDRGLERSVLFGDPDDAEGQCVLVDFTRLSKEPPAWTSINAATADFLGGRGAGLVGARSSIESLPAGRTGHLTGNLADGASYHEWYFTDGKAWFYLVCQSPDAPADGWRSIAETFEFLPADG